MISPPLTEFASLASNLTMTFDNPRAFSQYHGPTCASGTKPVCHQNGRFFGLLGVHSFPPRVVSDQQGAM